jgi:hypothetical protein
MGRLIIISLFAYLLIGLIRNMLKQAYLFNNNKIKTANDTIEFFQYTIKQPSFGDLLFLPVQILMLTIDLLICALFKLFSFLLK